MKINKLNWPKCPHCGLLINDMTKLPASLLLENFGTEMECPKCDNSFEIESRIELTFITYKREEDESI